MNARARLRLFKAAVASAAAAAALIAGPATPDPARLRLTAVLFVLSVIALQFPLHLSLTKKVSLASSAFFATVVLLPAPRAAALAAGAMAFSTAIRVLRQTIETRHLPQLGLVASSTIFGSSQTYLAVLCGGLTLRMVTVSPVLGLLLAGAVMYTLNMAAMNIATALATGRSPLRAFADTQRTVAFQFAIQYAIGLAGALSAGLSPFAPLLTIVPGALLYRRLQSRVRVTLQTIEAMEKKAEEVDRRDPYTAQHSERVAGYAVRIGRRLRLSRDEIDLLELAGKVHDIGKIQIPDSVLLKPGRLTAEEQLIMQAHPRIGHALLSAFREYESVLELVLTHHERYDGGGYPNGIPARGLKLMAQVLPVADSIDAMTTARPYREPLAWATAMDELRRGAGSQWNPQVVAAAVAEFSAQALAADSAPVAA